MEQFKFSRKPYTVTYKDLFTNELQVVKRRPPPVTHNLLPADIVELKSNKGSDWQAGEEFKIKHISYRQPNIIQLKQDDNKTTFIPASELILTEELGFRGKSQIDNEIENRYLLWP